jgi:hypothetical protein
LPFALVEVVLDVAVEVEVAVTLEVALDWLVWWACSHATVSFSGGAWSSPPIFGDSGDALLPPSSCVGARGRGGGGRRGCTRPKAEEEEGASGVAAGEDDEPSSP